MKIQVTLAVLFFGSFVSANSGIFSGDGQVLPTPVERSLDSRAVKGVLEKKETNAERLRRGLSPLPPSRFAPRARPSPRPCTLPSTPGYIKVTKPNGNAVGYISNEFDGQRSYTVTTSQSTALQVTLQPSSSPFGAPFNILAINGPDVAHPYLGAVGASSGYHFSPGQLGSAYLAGTGASPANSPPSSSAGTSMRSLGYKAPGESEIWSMNCRSGVITAQWTNADSSQPATTIFYDPSVNYLGLTSDLGVLNGHFGEGAYAVKFAFVPL
ncbi:hypothetical protein C8R44DRAFT_792296 [Mycena epipterygia]|nr:hypothetical protein C8R44DRAFT_792296 [Mycena epipterygia]